MGMIFGLLMLSRTPRSGSKASDLVLEISSAWVGQEVKGVDCFRNGYLNIQYGRGQQEKVLSDND